jgi:hypothetical protein
VGYRYFEIKLLGSVINNTRNVPRILQILYLR